MRNRCFWIIHLKCRCVLLILMLFTDVSKQLRRATIQHPVTGKLEYAAYRISKRLVISPKVQPYYTSFCQKKVPLSCTPRKYDNPFVLTFYVVTLRKCYNHILVKGPFKYLNYQFPCPFIYLNLRNPYPWPFVYSKR